MYGIGGNLIAEIQIGIPSTNAIGENINTWTTIQTIKGWLDYITGETNRTNFSAKIEESTHVFVADYINLDSRINAEKARMVINHKIYEITLIDNPMELNAQLEIYLKYVGG